MEIAEYGGPIDLRKCSEMSHLARKAYRTWISQRYKCSKPTSQDYKYYGAKGIKVKYAARPFIAWFLNQASTWPHKSICVGRKDHSRDYSFDNIRLETHSDSSKERISRLGSAWLKYPIAILTEKGVRRYKSQSDFCREFDISVHVASRRIKKRTCKIFDINEFMPRRGCDKTRHAKSLFAMDK